MIFITKIKGVFETKKQKVKKFLKELLMLWLCVKPILPLRKTCLSVCKNSMAVRNICMAVRKMRKAVHKIGFTKK